MSVGFNSLEELENKLNDKENFFELSVIGNNYVADIVDRKGNHLELTAPL